MLRRSAKMSASRKSIDIEGYDQLFKVVMVGDSGVGNSSILARYVNGTFSHCMIATIGELLLSTVRLGELCFASATCSICLRAVGHYSLSLLPNTIIRGPNKKSKSERT